MSNEIVVVVAAGEQVAPRAPLAVPRSSTVIAADGGLDNAVALGLDVDIAVGDFDSASPGVVAAAEAAGVRVMRHPAAKDATDLELALDLAIELSPRRIIVVAGRGGRLDHELAGLLLLASDRYAHAEVDALVGAATVHVVHGDRTFEGRPGDLLTLVPANGRAEGVTTEGLVYPLRDETLEPGSTRGVSNVFAAAMAQVSVKDGVLLAIRPEREQ